MSRGSEDLEAHHRESRGYHPLPDGDGHDPLLVAHVWQLGFRRNGFIVPRWVARQTHWHHQRGEWIGYQG